MAFFSVSTEPLLAIAQRNPASRTIRTQSTARGFRSGSPRPQRLIRISRPAATAAESRNSMARSSERAKVSADIVPWWGVWSRGQK